MIAMTVLEALCLMGILHAYFRLMIISTTPTNTISVKQVKQKLPKVNENDLEIPQSHKAFREEEPHNILFSNQLSLHLQDHYKTRMDTKQCITKQRQT